jgi:ribosomal protein S18 acetylase RimI-like enzyme
MMPDNHDVILIRQMEAGDIAGIARWMVETPLWQRYGVTVESATRSLEHALASNAWLLAADIGPYRAIGFAWCVPDGAFGRSPYLRLIGVRPDRAGVGIGGALLRAVEARAHEHNADHLLLLVSDFNEAAQHFYRRLGYAQVGALPGYVLPDVAELIYYKRLKPWNS